MTFKFSFLYEKRGSAGQSGRFLKPFEEIGFSLLHPSEGKVIRVDWDGEWLPIAESEFLVWLEQSQDASFLIWRDQSDLYIRLKKLASCEILEVGLEGTWESERSELLKSLEGYFRESCRSGRGMAFVFDPYGVSEDFDWSSLFAEQPPFRLDQVPAAEAVTVLVAWWAAENPGSVGKPDADGIIRVL